MCKKLCPQEPEPAPGKKFSEPEPPQNRPAPKPCETYDENISCRESNPGGFQELKDDLTKKTITGMLPIGIEEGAIQKARQTVVVLDWEARSNPHWDF